MGNALRTASIGGLLYLALGNFLRCPHVQSTLLSKSQNGADNEYLVSSTDINLRPSKTKRVQDGIKTVIHRTVRDVVELYMDYRSESK
ncbi:hypothetical protein B0O99DRAFT_611135 [Bisporella sp. PMI_857]|nr:hypothetical protein B0O99DRAFT_612073 [Bisporella sp. PMI_857]KAH8600619.1 hypothetical protein B0O99DRAFT_611135 [Bisporella sp. PMI_857]